MRIPASATLREGRIVAVLRSDVADHVRPAIDVLAEAGIRSIELTTTLPGVFELVDAVASDRGRSFEIGVGTVRTPEQTQRAADAGAEFVVTPARADGVVEAAQSLGLASIVGALTPTEVQHAWDLGATAVKIFPASAVEPRFLVDLHGPFPEIALVPSGGVDVENVGTWLKAGALAVCAGGPLIGDALNGGSLVALRARVAAFIQARDAALP